MKATNVVTYLASPIASPDGWSAETVFLFGKLEIDDVTVGWGEAYTLENRERAIEEIILSLGSALVSLPEEIRRAFRRHRAAKMARNFPALISPLRWEPSTS